jgi:hypothetical protein
MDHEEISKQYTPEQLELITQYNTTVYTKAAFERNEVHSKELHAQMLEQGQNAIKAADFHLESAKMSLRPHKMYHCDVFYDPNENKYVCRLPIGMIDDEEEEGHIRAISSYGDTPGAACDNFDHLWIHGPKDI